MMATASLSAKGAAGVLRHLSQLCAAYRPLTRNAAQCPPNVGKIIADHQHRALEGSIGQERSLEAR